MQKIKILLLSILIVGCASNSTTTTTSSKYEYIEPPRNSVKSNNQGQFKYVKSEFFLENSHVNKSIILDHSDLTVFASKNPKEVTISAIVRNVDSIKSLYINDELMEFKKDLEVGVNRVIQVGDNKFKIKSINYLGVEDEYHFNFTKISEEESRLVKLKEKEMALKNANDEQVARKRYIEQAKQDALNAKILEKARKKEEERIAREGDGSSEDKLCQRYGLKPQTNGYAECRMRLDFAKSDSIKQQQLQQQQQQQQQQQYEREQAAYEQQMAAIQKERERQRAMKQLELGLRMMGGQSPVDAVNSVGTGAPIAPRAPSPTNQTITLPNGRMINCTTMGTMTNCF